MNTTQTRKEELEKKIDELELDEKERLLDFSEFLINRRNRRKNKNIRLV